MALTTRARSTRRSFLRWSSLTLGLAATAPILQACGAAPPTPTTAPAKPAAAAAAEPTKPAAAPAAAGQTVPAAAAPAKVALKSPPFKVVQFDDYHPDHNKHVK